MSELDYSVKDHIATIRLNRPEKLNAFNPGMLKAWQQALRDAQADPEVRVVLLTGAGRAFCSGGDTGRMAQRAADTTAPDAPIDAKESLRAGPQTVAMCVQALEKPYIAAVNGVAAGAGMDMALMADIRLAGKSARFTEAYVRVGLMPGAGGCYFLPRIVGMSKALELFFTADFVDADEALRIGLVSHVYEDDKLMEEAYKLAARIAAAPPINVTLIKRTIYQSMTTDLRTSLDLVSSHMAVVRSTEDSKEAIKAFKEKRPGVFKNR
jgi:enoyl-CoA hydratase/carnithine racemase